MITVVNEPQLEYKVTGWRPKSKVFSFDDFIFNIKDETVLFYPPSRSISFMLSEKPKQKLSALRGKMTNQNEKEIDDQLLDLRNEWDRNI
jgi:hypothetical protein